MTQRLPQFNVCQAIHEIPNDHLRVTLDEERVLRPAGDEDDLGTFDFGYYSKNLHGDLKDGMHEVTPYAAAFRRLMVAAGPIDRHSQVYAADGGMVAADGTRKRGLALRGAKEKGQLIEVLTSAPYLG